MRGGAPRFRGGGRGFVGPGGLGPSPNRGAHLGSGGNDHRQRAPVRFRHWQTEIVRWYHSSLHFLYKFIGSN